MIVFSEHVQAGYYRPTPTNYNDCDRGHPTGNHSPRSRGCNNNQSGKDAKHYEKNSPKHFNRGERKYSAKERNDEFKHGRLSPTGNSTNSGCSEAEDNNEKHGVDYASSPASSPASWNASSSFNNLSKPAHEISDSSDSNSLVDYDNCGRAMSENDTIEKNSKLQYHVGNSNICRRATSEGAENSDVLREFNFKHCIIVELQSTDQFNHINEIRDRLEKKDVIEKFCILIEAKKILFQYRNNTGK